MAAPIFTAGERVLCYHGPLIYEAKVLKIEHWDESNTKLGTVGPHYFVHYKGWKQTWDEWVHSTRLLKYNDTNIALQKALAAQSNAAQAAASGSVSLGKGGMGSKGALKDGGRSLGRKEGRGTKRGREEDESSKRPEMKLSIPESLKTLLVDDWEAITKNNQLVTLPRSPNVQEILEQFSKYVLSKPSTTLKDPKTLLPTITAGLQTYFDRALGANLLYRFERPQYAEVRKQYVTGPNVKVGQEKEMSAVYGAEHLLRMLVNLPQMVMSSAMDSESVGLVRDYVNELMLYMEQEQARIFIPEYESSSLAYQNVSRS